MVAAVTDTLLDGPGATVNVLVVDDQASAREQLGEIFPLLGYAADTADCLHSAIERLRQRPYDVALLDVHLPDGSGLDLLAELKQIQPDAVCIMVTGDQEVKTAVEALNLGADAYIVKPVDIKELQAILSKATEKQRLARENQRFFEELSALRAVTDAALSTMEMGPLLARLVPKLVSSLHADAGAIFLVDDQLRVTHRSAPGLRPGEPRDDDSASNGLLQAAAAAEGPLLVHAPELWEQSDGVDWRASGTQSVLAVPLVARGHRIGVALVAATVRRDFSAEEQNLFSVLTERAAVVIDNARLFAWERELRDHAARLAEESRALMEVSRALVARVSLQERLELLAQHFLQATGSRRCAILLRERDAMGDRLILQLARGVSPRRYRWLVERNQRSRRARVLDLDDAGPALARFLADSTPTVVTDVVTVGILPANVARAWQIRSALLVPLQYEGRVTGVVALDGPAAERTYSDDQLRLASSLAYHAAVAIETAKIVEEERNIARKLQESFLSHETTVPHFELASRYEPASSVAQVGGDYFDFIELGSGRLGIVMADVCGKGITAAVYTAMAKYMLRAYATEDAAPASVVSRLNRALHSQMSEECMFLTLVFGVLDVESGRFRYANAGHPQPLLYRPSEDRFVELETTGGMVGALPEMPFGEAEIVIEREDVLAFFTDGVTEAGGGLQMLEAEGVQEVIRDWVRDNAPASWIADAIYYRARDASAGRLKDDVAIVVIRARDPAGA
jgi:serine phosphatase RsbU (regulator of sigma subunit)/putative methionine-R-sulfoxide reductase with GAF domain